MPTLRKGSAGIGERTMTKKPNDELAPEDLDAVVGGWATGGYITIGANAFGNGPSKTVTFGTDGIKVYDTQSLGIGNSVGAGVSAGGWVSSTTGSDYWTGNNTSFSAEAGQGGIL